MNRSDRLRRWGAVVVVVALGASLLALVGATPATAQQGGPDSFGYAYIDNQEVGGPAFGYTDISVTGTPVVGGDDAAATVVLPFPVALYGNALNQLNVSTNGVVGTAFNSEFVNRCLPAGGMPGDSLFVLWDDLITTVRTQTIGVAPNRRFIIQWNGSYFGAGGSVAFNLTLTEGSPNFLYRYQTVGQGGVSSTVGMQAAGGATSFLQYSCNQAGSVPGGRAIDFNFVGTNTGETPRVSVGASTAEATEGGDPGMFRFTRTGDRFSTFTVTYSVAGTATSGDDFEALPGTVNFPYGATSVDVPVTALTDSVVDPDETVTVNLEFGPYDRVAPTSATVTIAEPAPPACSDIPEDGFPDVPADYEHEANIDCITAYGLAEGYPDGTYRFRPAVTRAQMASFVARLLDRAGVALPANPPDAFTADDGGVHELAIDQLAALGIFDGTTGEIGETYGQRDPMRRDDMAQILVNAYKVITSEDLPAGPDAFTDDEGTDATGTGTDNEDAINALAAAGVVQGTGGGLYDPDGSVTRGQFASFFARYLQVLVDAGTTIERRPLT